MNLFPLYASHSHCRNQQPAKALRTCLYRNGRRSRRRKADPFDVLSLGSSGLHSHHVVYDSPNVLVQVLVGEAGLANRKMDIAAAVVTELDPTGRKLLDCRYDIRRHRPRLRRGHLPLGAEQPAVAVVRRDRHDIPAPVLRDRVLYLISRGRAADAKFVAKLHPGAQLFRSGPGGSCRALP